MIQLLSLAAAVGYAALYLFLSLQRIGYPFELEWMEGGSLEHLLRVLRGEPLYVTPSIEFVPFPYPPFYYYLSAALSPLTGAGFFTLRLVSLFASLASAVVVFRFVQRETGRAGLGVVCAGVFLATWREAGLYFDIARLDSLFCFLLLLWLYLLRFSRGWAGLAGAALAAFLCVMTKQTGAVVAGVIVPWCVWDDWRRRSRDVARGRDWRLLLGFGLPLVALVGLGTLLLNGIVDEHFLLHILGAQQQHGIRSGMIGYFFWRDLLVPLPLACFVIVAWGVVAAVRPGSRSQRSDGFLALSLLGILLACLIPRIKVSGAVNNLIPAYAWLAILFGIGLHRLQQWAEVALPSAKPQLALTVGLCGLAQLLVLAYDPRGFVPAETDLAGGRGLLAKISQVEGEVLLPAQGYLASLAGKRAFAHQMPASDYTKSGLSEASALEESYLRAIREQRFAMIIDSNTAFLLGYLEPGELERYYRRIGWAFSDAHLHPPHPGPTRMRAAFVPISGAPIRPGAIWIPRDDLGLTSEKRAKPDRAPAMRGETLR